VVRAVKWGEGSNQFVTASDPFTSRDLGQVSIFDFPTPADLTVRGSGSDNAPMHEPRISISVDENDKVTCLAITIADEEIIAGFDSGMVVKYNMNTGEEIMRKKLHFARVNRINFNREKSIFITASADNYAKLVDPATLEVIKEYKTDRPVNGACIMPIHPHILLGGGQDAQNVTTTSARSAIT
jgi:WD40 repeat protein